jgi:hypothetical protein
VFSKVVVALTIRLFWGFHHVAFRMASVDDAMTELKRRDVTIVSEAHDVAKLWAAFSIQTAGRSFPFSIQKARSFSPDPNLQIAYAAYSCGRSLYGITRYSSVRPGR